MREIWVSNLAGKIPSVNQLEQAVSNLGYNRVDAIFYGLKVVGGVKTVVALGSSLIVTSHDRLHAMDSVTDHAPVSGTDKGKIPQADPVTGEWKLVVMPEGGGGSSSINLALSKSGANGTTYPQLFKFETNLTIASVSLLSNCSEISVTIGATTYNKTTLVGVTLMAGTEMSLNDMTVIAGKDSANALLILTP